MLNSRLALSMLAAAFCTLVTLAWRGASQALTPGNVGAHAFPTLYVAGIACFFCLVFWGFVYFRDSGYRYMVSSRILLSAISAAGGGLFAVVLIDLKAVHPIELQYLSAWETTAFVGGTGLVALCWLGIFFKVRRAQRKVGAIQD